MGVVKRREQRTAVSTTSPTSSSSSSPKQQQQQQGVRTKKWEDLDDADIPSLVELKRALPAESFKSELSTSLYYAARDLVFAGTLLLAVQWLDSLLLGSALHSLRYVLWPTYWFLQGTVFWGLFVVAHDCGHGSFSPNQRLNDCIGTVLNALILVPYMSWRLSHRHHHKNTGCLDKDEVYRPFREHERPSVIQHGYFGLGITWPIYLFHGYATPRSHFNWNDPMFIKHKIGTMASVAGVASMAFVLYKWEQRIGLAAFAMLYVVPYFVFAMYLMLTTFLHHTEVDTPWYGVDSWTYVKGNLSSVDRDYGWLVNELAHNIGTHQVHHLFPIIPHYKLVKTTEVFRAKFPHLVRKSDERILPAFVRMFNIFSKQCVIPEDVQHFAYKENE
eukprot:TRINITY_DN54871_c0_g1_i2.p1 TRINITY_DN54871_c0_g1~~TRINITY_DN54871_c0_g1_i2.p1  ORF type:complete len:388 (+),score=191.88 TRINITY_DN54871_c0_g1_i2:83-1246(+)